MLKYTEKIKVDGVGEYEMTQVKVIDTRTFQDKSQVPKIMSEANVLRTRMARVKRLMQEKLKISQE